MTNLVQRLRAYQCEKLSSCWLHHPPIADEAASEIERLRREVEYLRHYGNKSCTAMADEAMERGDMEA